MRSKRGEQLAFTAAEIYDEARAADAEPFGPLLTVYGHGQCEPDVARDVRGVVPPRQASIFRFGHRRALSYLRRSGDRSEQQRYV